jgi:hypothetical protein
MLRKSRILIIFIIGFFVNDNIIYADDICEENPNDISRYNLERINNNILKPLSMLESLNENIYNIIIRFIPMNEQIENYYYVVSYNLIRNENIYFYFTFDEYNVIRNLPKFRNYKVNIEYAIFYYEILFNKYNSWLGDPTGRCFSVVFNKNNEFIRRDLWK